MKLLAGYSTRIVEYIESNRYPVSPELRKCLIAALAKAAKSEPDDGSP